jgi:hypothetical protein
VPAAEYGRLTIIPEQLMARTIMPEAIMPDDLVYDITVSRSGYESVVLESLGYEIDGFQIDTLLAVGDWDVTVNARRSGEETILFSGSDTVTIAAVDNTVHITLIPLQVGTGSFDFSMTWPAEMVAAVEILWKTKLTDAPVNPDDWPFSAAVDEGEGEGRLGLDSRLLPLASGSYFLTIRLKDAEDRVLGRVSEVVLILDGQHSTKHIDITAAQLSSPPEAPSGLIIQSYARDNDQQLTGVTINWTDNSVINDGFRAWRLVSGEGGKTQISGDIAADLTSYTDTDVGVFAAGQTITYYVEAFNAFGVSSQDSQDSPTLRTLIYDANSGDSGAVPSSILYFTGETVTVLYNPGSLERFAHDFAGWSETVDGVAVSSLVMPAIDKILYARWDFWFSGGAGTEAQPYLIGTVPELLRLHEFIGAVFADTYFRLEASLDLDPAVVGAQWSPIGTESAPFMGHFDGNGKTITKMTITSGNRIGFFGQTHGATISALHLVGVNVNNSTSIQVGGIVGYNGNAVEPDTVTTITGCTVEGSFVVNHTAGGLVGYSRSALTIAECSTEIAVIVTTGSDGANFQTGGLLGETFTHSSDHIPEHAIYRSSAKVSVERASGGQVFRVGGLVGRAQNMMIEDCYAVVTIPNAGNNVGGLLGQAWGHDNFFDDYAVFVRRCYATGSIRRPGVANPADVLYVGAFVGTYPAILPENFPSYFINTFFEFPGLNERAIGSNHLAVHYYRKEISDLLQKKTFTDMEWNFDTIWQMQEWQTYPYLQWQVEIDPPGPVELPILGGGSGTSLDPYRLYTVDHLKDLHDYIGSAHAGTHFKLMTDLTLSEPWQRIGGPVQQTGQVGNNANSFMGHFDGGGHTVYNLQIDVDSTDINDHSYGLFGVVYNATIMNLHLRDVVLSSNRPHLGAIVGYVIGNTGDTDPNPSHTRILNCSVTGTLNGDSSSVGGIVGRIGMSNQPILFEMEGCWTDIQITTNVAGTWGAGGLVGGVQYGGIDPHIVNMVRGSIRESFAMGSIVSTSATMIGGIIGRLNGLDVIDSYAVVDITSAGNNIGGLIGRVEVAANYPGVVRCHVAGRVPDNTGTGAINGYNLVGQIFFDVYFDTTGTGLTRASSSSFLNGMTGKPTIEMLQQATFTNWSFYAPENTWQISAGESYPYLQWQSGENVPYPEHLYVGGPGPAGGIVFYDKGDETNGWRYLEAWTVDEGSYWWKTSETSTGGTSRAIGSGYFNTYIAMINTVHPAAEACRTISHNGYLDWFLPSKDELNQMYIQRNFIGGFAAAQYWSSSEHDYISAWRQSFSTGTQSDNDKKEDRLVRAVRVFRSENPLHIVKYDANGATSGTVPEDYTLYEPGESGVPVASNSGSLARSGFGFSFAGWNTEPDGSGIHYPSSTTMTMPSGNVTLYAEWQASGLLVGNDGPAGGKVFYDKGSYSNGWRYLEAWTVDEARYKWKASNDSTPGTSTAIGSGYSNTYLAMTGIEHPAAEVCRNANYGGFNDWFLPSKDELSQMYIQSIVIGGFTVYDYWSSSESNSPNAWAQNFEIGNQIQFASKGYERRVRVVRTF